MHFIRLFPFLCVVLLFPQIGHAIGQDRVAVVVSQAVGVGALADRLGNLVADHLGKGSVQVIGPGEAARLLRERGGKDPSSCGSDTGCLRQLGQALGARWVVALGVGSFGEIYSLELRAMDREEAGAPKTTSSTYALPGPDWEVALGDALQKIVPRRLLYRLGELVIQSESHGAELRVDGLPAGTLPLNHSLRLPAGEHQVELNLEGYSSAREKILIEAGGYSELRLTLVPIRSPAPRLRPYVLAASGTAAAALVTAIGFHIGAASAMDDARASQEAGRPFSDERERALGRMTVSRISYGLAGTAAVGAAVLYFLDARAAQANP